MTCAMYLAYQIWIFTLTHPNQPIPMPKCPYSDSTPLVKGKR